MNRAIDARLHRIERAIAPDPQDEFGLSKLTEDDLARLLHNTLSRIAENEGDFFTPEEVSEARAKLVKLEAEVWDHVEYERRPDIAAAIASNNAAGRNGKPWHRDWEGLGREWGLLDADGSYRLAPCPMRPRHEPIEG